MSEASDEFGSLLREIRRQKRFSKKSLGDAAKVSDSYIGRLEEGRKDPRTGKPTKPSPGIIKSLADALSDHDEAEARSLYQRFLIAAGYLERPQREQVAPRGAPPTLRMITRMIRDTRELPDEEKEFFVSLMERSAAILRGQDEVDPGHET